VSFSLLDNNLTLDVGVFLTETRYRAEPEVIARVLAPLLEQHRMRLVSFLSSGEYVGSSRLWDARFGFHVRGRALSEPFQVGCDVISLLTAMRPCTAAS
jgi:hypothetical protein